jgi:ABC-type phosphate/phosphonate transport system substrate-binding protein
MGGSEPPDDASKGVVSLPMYDWPEVRPANDALWAAIRSRLLNIGIIAPEALVRNGDPEAAWSDPDLILSQTCGFPYANRLARQVALVATPAYRVTGAAPGNYFSVLVGRKADPPQRLSDLRHRRFGYNMAQSQSGFAAPVRLLAASEIQSLLPPLETGAHRASVRAVANGDADWAAIDAVAWEFAKRHEPASAELAVFARTPETPGLPLISSTRMTIRTDDMADAIDTAIAGLDPAIRDAVFLSGLVRLTPRDYAPLAAALPVADVLPGLHP